MLTLKTRLTICAAALLVPLPLNAQTVITIAAPPAEEKAELTPDQITIESIVCSGNESTDCDLIRRELKLEPGDKIDEEEIQNAKIRLGLRGLFKSVDITLKKGSERGKAIVEIKVEEDSAFFSAVGTGSMLRPGGLFTPLGGSQATIIQDFRGSVGYRNLFGKGKILRADIGYQHSIGPNLVENQALGLEYVDPELLGSKRYFWSTGISYRHSYSITSGTVAIESSSIDVDGNVKEWTEYLDWSSRSAGISLIPSTTLGVRFADYSYFSLGVGYILKNDSRYRYTSYQQNTVPWSYDYDGGKNFKYVVSANYGWNSTDDPVFPTQGSIFDFGIGYFGGGEAIWRFFPIALGFKKYWSLTERSHITLNIGNPAKPAFESPADLVQRVALLPTNFIIGAGYGYDFKRHQYSDTIQNARLSLDAGTQGIGYGSVGGEYGTVGGRVGLTLDVKSIGNVNFFFLGNVPLKRSGQ